VVGASDCPDAVARDNFVFNMSERSGNLWMTNFDER
jgi:hypothetical protein